MAEARSQDGPGGSTMEAAEVAVVRAAQGVATSMEGFAQAVNNWQQVSSKKRREADKQTNKCLQKQKLLEERTEDFVKYLEEKKKKSSNVVDQNMPGASNPGTSSLQGRQVPPEGAGTSSPVKRARTLPTDSIIASETLSMQQQTPSGHDTLGIHFMDSNAQTRPPSSHMPSSSKPTSSHLSDEQMSLYRAVKAARTNDVRTLLKLKVNPHFKDNNGDTLLHIAVNNAKTKDKDNSSAKILKEFLDKGKLDVNAQNSAGQTPLHVAASIQSGERCVNILLLYNADVNMIDSKGDTPLHCAVRIRQKEIAKALIRRGALFVVKNKEGKMPIDEATDDDMREILKEHIQVSQSADESFNITDFLEMQDGSDDNEMSDFD